MILELCSFLLPVTVQFALWYLCQITYYSTLSLEIWSLTGVHESSIFYMNQSLYMSSQQTGNLTNIHPPTETTTNRFQHFQSSVVACEQMRILKG